METDNPALTGWTPLGKHGLAWFRGHYRIQSNGNGGWGMHFYDDPTRIARNWHRANPRYLGAFDNLDAVEQRIQEAVQLAVTGIDTC